LLRLVLVNLVMLGRRVKVILVTSCSRHLRHQR